MEKSDARDYQEKAMQEIRQTFIGGNRKVLLWLATGAGKTFIFCRMVKDAVARGRRCIIVVRGRKLVDQASQRLFREGVHHGVLMANHWNFRPGAPVQVCSIDTLIARDLTPEADLIIVDEAHLFDKASRSGQFFSRYPEKFIVAVTATPWVNSGLRHVADKVVHPITMNELIEAGYLVPFRYFAPDVPDVSGVKINRMTKDYVTEDLADAMISGQLTGRVVDHWLKIARGRPTIGFAVNVRHSKIMTERFVQAGVRAEHVDATATEKERSALQKRLESGETEIVWNYGILGTGVDIPPLAAIVLARPTQSRNLYIQQSGRGTRTYPGKSDCILLDHAGNIMRHGLPTDEDDVDLDGAEPVEKSEKESKICKACFAVYRGGKCPECGALAPEPPPVDIKESDHELKEITQIVLSPEHQALKQLMKEAKKTGRKTAWAYYKLVDRFGYNEETKKHLPQWFKEKQEQSVSELFARSPFKGFKI